MRNFRSADGAHLRELLLTLSDRDYVSTFCMLDSEISLERYVATVRSKPVTDGQRTCSPAVASPISCARPRSV